MHVWITGSGSFVGRELIELCERAGITTSGIDAAAIPGSGFTQADVRSRDLADTMPEGADAIVHLAAMSRDSDCTDKAYECFDVNVMGTLNVMRAAQQRRARQFIFASSEWVYGSFEDDTARDEDSVIDLRTLASEYALSKLVGEAVLRQKHARGFIDCTVLRFGIIYGPRPGNWSAVESLMHAVRSDQEVKIGSAATARRFIHVADVASGIVKSVGLPGFNLINLEGPRMVTLGEIVETAGRVLGKSPNLVVGSAPPSIRNVSNNRATQLLGWQPAIDLEAGLRSLVAFV